MSDYEFWDELGNIFNAIVAFQQKTIEFNNRFVNPWIRLGTVFDQNDHNAESLQAHKKAIEIDRDNAANWLSLGDVYFKMGAFEDAAGAYRKALELNPRLGWAYANLALTYATQQKYTEAVNLYVKSLELITDEKDCAMIWNRLGNVYRKVNDYENAFLAFQMADECDGQNTGFQDKLDDVTVEQRVMPIVAEVYVNEPVKQDVPESSDETAEDRAPAESVGPEEAVTEPNTEVVQAEISPTPNEEALSQVATEDVAAESALEHAAESATAEELVSSEATVSATLTMGEEQGAESNAPIEEIPSTVEQDADLTELEQLIEIVTMEPLAEQPAVVDVVQKVDESVTELEPGGPVAEETVIEAPNEPSAIEPSAEEGQEESASESETLPVAETISAEEQPDATAVSVLQAPQAEDVIEFPSDDTASDVAVVEKVEEQPLAETHPEEEQAEADAEARATEIVIEEVQADAERPTEPEFSGPDTTTDTTDTTITPIVSQAVETFANPLAFNQPTVLVVEDLSELIEQAIDEGESPVASTESESQPDVQTETSEPTEQIAEVEAQPEPVGVPADQSVSNAAEDSLPEIKTDASSAMESPEPAYEEFLKDAVVPEIPAVEEQVGAPIVELGVDTAQQSTELTVEPDTKNAHVWNELGNVYFNTGSLEEAVTAYSKAIELDDWFAWPYSNLALVYVQKEKYTEAILLYQRSIELFTSDKDKAITWNRLGNVYRRLNDYENAIACYQRADALDPNNTTRSLRSRFSLLGSLSMEQSPSLAV